jgi:hypothetical protein
VECHELTAVQLPSRWWGIWSPHMMIDVVGELECNDREPNVKRMKARATRTEPSNI